MLRTLLSRLRDLERRCDESPAVRFLCAVWVLNVLALVILTFVHGPQAWRLMLWPFVEVTR